MKINTLLCFVCSLVTVLQAQNSNPLFFSEYGEGSGNHKYLEIYNSGSESVSLADYALARVSNEPTVVGEYETWSDVFPNDASIAPGGVYIIAHASADAAITSLADITFSSLSNGDDGFALVMGTQDNPVYVDWVGDFNGDPGSGWTVCDDGSTLNSTLVRKCEVTSGAEWLVSSASSTCQWDIHPSNTWDFLGFHCAIPVAGCTDAAATNYSADALSDDGSCIYYTIHNINAGNFYFTDITETVYVGDQVCWINDGGYHDINFAASYGNPQELVDQYLSPNSGGDLGCITFNTAGSFIYDCSIGDHASQGMIDTITVVEIPGPALSIKGVMDLNAPSSSNDGKAIHLVANDDIPDLSLFGFNNSNNGGGSDGVEWTFPAGYSASAGDDILIYRVGTDPNFFSSYFGDCFSEFELTITNSNANSVLTMNGDDPMELFQGDDVIDNYEDVNITTNGLPGDPYEDSWVYRTDDGTWIGPGEDGDVESNDAHSVYTSNNPYPLCSIVYGCTDSTALNFDSNAHVDTGVCNYPADIVLGCTDSTAFNFNPDATQDDESCIAVVEGCTDTTAFNHVYNANTDDGSCIAVELGCLDENALNTDSLANTEDGSCEYPPLTNALTLQGVLDLYGNDGPNGANGNDGKAFHLKVHQDVSNLSIFSLDVVSNGTGTLNPDEFRLSGSASAGDDILVFRTDGSETFMADYFGACYAEFEIKINTGMSWPTHNGDDGTALFENYTLIDSLTLNDTVLLSGPMSGDPYEDSWAYRNEDGSWNFAGKDLDQNDNSYSVYTSGAPYPLCPDNDEPVSLTNALSLQGVLDLFGGTASISGVNGSDGDDGKAFHLKVHQDVPDLSIFSLDVVSNGSGTLNSDEFILSGSASAGDDILVYRTSGSETFFADYFGDCYSEFEIKIPTGSTFPTHNGDDGAALFENYILIDSLTLNDSVLFSGAMPGDPYEDSWAYRNHDGTWNFAGEDADQVDSTYSVYTSGAPYPLCAVAITGCTDPTAVNYNSEADEDDGSCFDLSSVPLTLQGVMDLYGSTYGNLGYSGTDGKAIHLVATADISDLSLFSIGVANGGGSDGPEYELSGSVSAGDDILVYRVGSADSSANFFSDYFGACYAEFELKIATGTNFPDGNGDDPIELFQGTYVVDFYGDIDSEMSGDPYEDSWAYRNEDGSWLEGGEDCDEDDNSYSVFSSGCPYPICNVQEIVGCTDTLAFNYNSFAVSDDSSCIAVLEDCLDEDAENYNTNANTSCSSCCAYLGCTDITALNYDENATQDDGSCVTDTATLTYALSLQGVLDLYGSGIDSLYSGLDGKAIHLVANADILDLSVFSLSVANNGEGSELAEYPLSGSATAGDDILIYRVGNGPSSASFMSDYFGECFSEFEITIADTSGFPDGNGDDPIELFENYLVIDSYGDVNGGPMVGDPYEDSWAYRNDDGSWLEGGEDCDQDDGTYTVAGSGCPYPICGLPILGCTDSLYMEYYPAANSDDGSCLTLIINGCMDSSASNYNSSANVDDNSCEYSGLTNALMIQGIMDLNGTPLSNDGKAIHLVATADISDLSIFGIGVANNGSGTDGIEWTFPVGFSATAGDDILVYRVGTDTNFFANYFGACFSEFEYIFTDESLGSVLQQSGDDPVELFEDDVVIDNFGDVDGGAFPGDPYNDSWAYRNADSTWTYGGNNCDDEVLELDASEQTYSVYTSGCPYPLCPPLPCNAPEDWGYTVTGSNHTIMIPETVVVSLADGTVLSDAFVGVFFTDGNGDLICAGYEQANGSTVQIAAWADDTTTPEVDGLSSGLDLVWMIADCNGNVFPANAGYSNGPEVFTINGVTFVSTLTEIPAGPTEQVLNFPSGWSMFSTYMVAADMNLITLLAPIISNVIIAKDYLGAAYLPEYNFNGVGDLNIGQGYQIKTLLADSIIITGEYAFPEDNQIDIVAGWNMIGYLRTESAAADAVLADINATGNLIIAKNYLGAAYLPEWNFNGIGTMMPGQGYQIKVTNADVLQYLPNDQSYRMSTLEVTENTLSHFAKVVPTDNNMTVVIEDAVWDVLPTEGAEISAFDKDGNLVGSAIYSSPVTVLAIWGDDATSSSKDGMEVSEPVSFKVWNTNDVRDFTVSKWIEGSSSYQVDAINIASSIETNIMTELNTPVRVLVKVINVLGQEVNMDDEPFKGTILFKVYDDGSVERFVE